MVQYGRSSRSSWTTSVRPSFGRTTTGKAIWENPIETWLGETSKLGMSLCTSWKRMNIKLAGKKQNLGPMWKVLNQRSWFGRTNIFPGGSCIPAVHSKTMWNKQRYGWQLQNNVCIQNFHRSNWKNYHAQEICVSLRGPTIWRVMPRNVWNDIVSGQTRRLSNSTKYLLHALMAIITKKKNWDPWDNCQKYALK